MQEFELQCILPGTDELALQNSNAHQHLIFECSPERPAAVIAIKQQGRVLFRFARRPALYIEVIRLKRSEEHTSELQSRLHLVCRLLLEKKKKHNNTNNPYH